MIEAFESVELPNVLTNGGPGTATESLTLPAFFRWGALDLGGSAAIVGVSRFLIFRSIGLPLAVPRLVTGMVIALERFIARGLLVGAIKGLRI